MATKAKSLPQEIDKVLIPATLLARLGHFLDSLKQQIRSEAVARAFARKSGPAAGRVTTDDIVRATRSILKSSSAEVAQSLQASETRHDRRKAS